MKVKNMFLCVSLLFYTVIKSCDKNCNAHEHCEKHAFISTALNEDGLTVWEQQMLETAIFNSFAAEASQKDEIDEQLDIAIHMSLDASENVKNSSENQITSFDSVEHIAAQKDEQDENLNLAILMSLGLTEHEGDSFGEQILSQKSSSSLKKEQNVQISPEGLGFYPKKPQNRSNECLLREDCNVNSTTINNRNDRIYDPYCRNDCIIADDQTANCSVLSVNKLVESNSKDEDAKSNKRCKFSTQPDSTFLAHTVLNNQNELPSKVANLSCDFTQDLDMCIACRPKHKNSENAPKFVDKQNKNEKIYNTPVCSNQTSKKLDGSNFTQGIPPCATQEHETAQPFEPDFYDDGNILNVELADPLDETWQYAHFKDNRMIVETLNTKVNRYQDEYLTIFKNLKQEVNSDLLQQYKLILNEQGKEPTFFVNSNQDFLNIKGIKYRHIVKSKVFLICLFTTCTHFFAEIYKEKAFNYSNLSFSGYAKCEYIHACRKLKDDLVFLHHLFLTNCFGDDFEDKKKIYQYGQHIEPFFHNHFMWNNESKDLESCTEFRYPYFRSFYRPEYWPLKSQTLYRKNQDVFKSMSIAFSDCFFTSDFYDIIEWRIPVSHKNRPAFTKIFAIVNEKEKIVGTVFYGYHLSSNCFKGRKRSSK